MATKIDTLEGVGPALAEKFAGAGVKNVEDLLEAGKTPSGRGKLSDATGLSEKRILTFVNMADLMRIKGVGGEYAELLQASGVDTVKELRRRNAENLATKMDEVNAEKELTRTVPNAKTLQGWIDQAGEMDPVVEY